MMNSNTYVIGETLLQAVVSALNEMPAARVRQLLNAIESECVTQDRARAEEAKTCAEAELRRTIKAELTAAAPIVGGSQCP
jgi:hypothetical protein